MSSSLSADAVLDRVYLEIRCKLLDIAACLDRVARAEETRAEETRAEETRAEETRAHSPADEPNAVESDARLAQIAQGIDILSSPGLDRAERIQMLFSDPYVAHWNHRDSRAANGTAPHN